MIRANEIPWRCGSCGHRWPAPAAPDHVCPRCGDVVDSPEPAYAADAVTRIGLEDRVERTVDRLDDWLWKGPT